MAQMRRSSGANFGRTGAAKRNGRYTTNLKTQIGKTRGKYFTPNTPQPVIDYAKAIGLPVDASDNLGQKMADETRRERKDRLVG